MKDCCELDASYSECSTELFNAYKEYCDVTRDADKLGKNRVLIGIKLGEMSE